jgi:hypothetical protein
LQPSPAALLYDPRLHCALPGAPALLAAHHESLARVAAATAAAASALCGGALPLGRALAAVLVGP